MSVSAFPCPITQFHVEHTVVCGQTFRWHLDHDGWWACLLTTTDAATGARTHTLVRLRQDAGTVFFETTPRPDDLAQVRDYFRLDVDLDALAREFVASDPGIAPALETFAGLRVIRQDPVECLFSFLCTSAAPLHRIRRSISGLCREYGEPWPRETDGHRHFTFPAVERLAEADITDLMRLGVGYRARYIKASAQVVRERGGAPWLLSLRSAPYAAAKEELTALPGVGEKIADCVCLFSLDKDEAIPVDTHIRQIAYREYLGTPIAKTLTRASYAQIGDLLRARFGPWAGWAQQYLFYQDLFEKGAWAAYAAQLRAPVSSR